MRKPSTAPTSIWCARSVPSAWPIIEGINNNILSGDLYRALKEARKLIAYEKNLKDQYDAMEAERKVGSAA